MKDWMVFALVTLMSTLLGAIWWITDGPVFGVAYFLFIWLCFFGGMFSAGWRPLSRGRN
jgi:hypothetical protein